MKRKFLLPLFALLLVGIQAQAREISRVLTPPTEGETNCTNYSILTRASG